MSFSKFCRIVDAAMNWIFGISCAVVVYSLLFR